MGDFKPSGNFVSGVMDEIRSYERAISCENEINRVLPLSKPIVSILSAVGVLLGFLNLARIASILLSPTPCL